MFKFLKKNKTNPTDVQSSGDAKALSDSNEPLEQLADLLIQDEILCEMPLYKELDCSKLDYSVSSLTSIDDYLSSIRKNPLESEDLHRVILRVGAYVGEVIRRNISMDINWLGYQEAARVSPMVEKLGNQPGTMAVLWAAPSGITFPLAKVQKFIQNGPEDSTRMFAEAMISRS